MNRNTARSSTAMAQRPNIGGDIEQRPISGGVNSMSFNQALQFAELLADGNFVPQSYRGKPGDVLAAIIMGAEVGLAPMTSLRSIAVINGRPSLWGDGLWGLVIAHPEYRPHTQRHANATAYVTCRRERNGQLVENTYSFGWEDAKRAGLANKDTYKSYPKDMCMRRAKWRAAYDMFADALSGLQAADEYGDSDTVQAIEPLRSNTVAREREQQDDAGGSWGFEPTPDEPATDEPLAETAADATEDDGPSADAWARAEAAAKAARE